jgi:hypothetical protein
VPSAADLVKLFFAFTTRFLCLFLRAAWSLWGAALASFLKRLRCTEDAGAIALIRRYRKRAERGILASEWNIKYFLPFSI